MTIKSQIEDERKIQSAAIERRKLFLREYSPFPTHRDQVAYVLALTQVINECQTRIDYLTVSRADSPND